MMSTRPKHTHKGFTLVELLVALAVTAIVSSAVAALACAVGAANDATEDTSWKQAQVRYSTHRISDLIRHCKLICGAADNDLAIWQADYNADGVINPRELVYLEAGPYRGYLRLLEFPSAEDWPLLLSNIRSGATKQELELIFGGRRVALVPSCSSVQFLLDAAPPWTKSVSVSFNLVENGGTHQYQINAVLRGWAGNLVGTDGDSMVSDDD
ncbi:MAG: prepilin-type N-terminal cleavage/methylation domain-containing protein [Planctomycetota bacterium]|jgi:prepilin-type N-terminal cleavage/methylation domain-containing protein